MKKLLIAFSMIGAGALIASADNSVKPNYDKATWFNASAEGTEIKAVGGSFSTKTGSEATFAAKESQIEFDSEIDDPVSFKLSNETATKTNLTRVAFELDASVVPYVALPEAKDLTGAKTAFALVASSDKTATNFYAWVKQNDGSVWQDLAFSNIPNVDEPYELTMKFDDSATAKKVQFAVALNNITNVSAWLEYEGLSEKPQIDFVGCGKLTSMSADRVWIVSSEIIIEGGSVTIAKEDETAMGKLVKEGDTIETVLADEVTNRVSGIANTCKLSTAEAYAIGLIAKGANDTMVAKADGTFKVKADAQATVSDAIPVGFVTPLTPNDKTATVLYTLKGSADGKVYSPIAGMADKTNINEITIPTSAITEDATKYRYFKVVTTVTLKGAN